MPELSDKLGAELERVGDEYRVIASATLDRISTTQGTILYRNATDWVALSPGTAGYALETLGAAANPAWASISTFLDTLSSTQGAVLYRNATAWVALSPGTSGNVLTTQGSGADPLYRSVSYLLDSIGGSTRGEILIRGASTWYELAAGTSGQYLRTQGSGADPQWADVSVLTMLSNEIGSTQGTIIYYNGTAWTALATGTDGQVLQTQGAGANPQWASLYSQGDRKRIWTPAYYPLDQASSAAAADRAFFNYLGYVERDTTFMYVYLQVGSAGSGTQTAEVALLSSPAAPNSDGLVTLTKIVADGTVDDLTSTGLKRNTNGFNSGAGQVVSAGTHLWAGFRSSMGTSQHNLLAADDYSEQNGNGYTSSAGALTGAGPWTLDVGSGTRGVFYAVATAWGQP